MTQLTAPGGTSMGLTRLGRDARTSVDDLGPLADLVGVWIGTQGWELIAVPSTEQDGKEGFRFIARPYAEVISFSPIGAPVPNRGGPAGDMFITGLMYDMRITDLATNEPLHLETGMWLNLSDVQGGPPPAQPIARSATIPHGDSLLAIGSASDAPGPPDIPMTSAVPYAGPGKKPLGYTDPWDPPAIPSPLTHVPGFLAGTPNEVLKETIADLDVLSTTTLSLSTANGGGILNIPFVDANAQATEFTCDYWIETVQDKGNPGRPEPEPVQQLQYSQQTNISFLPQFGDPEQLIMWPHVNVNTLRKQ
jgi:hypothetical protein